MNRLDVVAWFQIGIDDRMHLLAAMMSDKNLTPFFLVKISQCLRQNRLVGKVFKTNHATYNCRRIQVKETDGRTAVKKLGLGPLRKRKPWPRCYVTSIFGLSEKT